MFCVPPIEFIDLCIIDKKNKRYLKINITTKFFNNYESNHSKPKEIINKYSCINPQG